MPCRLLLIRLFQQTPTWRPSVAADDCAEERRDRLGSLAEILAPRLRARDMLEAGHKQVSGTVCTRWPGFPAVVIVQDFLASTSNGRG